MKSNPRPWRVDQPWVDALVAATERQIKAAFTVLIAERDARISQLEHDLAAAVARIDKEWAEPT